MFASLTPEGEGFDGKKRAEPQASLLAQVGSHDAAGVRRRSDAGDKEG